MLSYHAFVNLLTLAGLISLVSLAGLLGSLAAKSQPGLILSALGVCLFPCLMGFGTRLHRPRPQAGLTACKSNLKNIATALEMYATDSSGSLPHELGRLTPNYLKTIPTCPVARGDTYSTGYEQVAGTPALFTVTCRGSQHVDAGVAVDRPYYNSKTGVVDR